MGQYFKLVNLDKKEQVGGTLEGWIMAKFLEWCVNDSSLLPLFLLRRSDESGGGDIDFEKFKFLGRWAGDRVILIGDYDSSGLWNKTEKWRNLWEDKEFREEFKEFVEWVKGYKVRR